MELLSNSRFITYPSIVEKTNNHTVVLIDANEVDIENVGLFCKVSNKNYDIYLCRSDADLAWVSDISVLADMMLINQSNNKNIPNSIKFGKDCEVVDPLAYFQNFDAVKE
jgi:hypothetical protein